MTAILSLTFHGCCAIFHMYVIHWLMFRVGLEILEMASFFTVWTTVFHLVLFLALTAHDAGRIFDNQATKHGDSPIRSLGIILNNEGFLGLFLHLAIVMSSFNQFGFWLLFYIDRELILPETAPVPSSHNHMMHTIPLFLTLFAVNVFASNFPNAKQEKSCRTIARAGVKLVGLVSFVYLTFIWILFELRGIWPYLFMFSFTRFDYFIFALCSFIISLILCYVCSFVETKIKNVNIFV